MDFLEWKCMHSDRIFSLKFVPRGPINNIPALVQIMAWHWCDKSLSEPILGSAPTSRRCHTWFEQIGNALAAGDHAWLATVNWWFMQAAGPHTSSIRTVACIVPVYCVNISETVTFTATWSKSLIVYATKIHMCYFWWEIPNDRWVRRTRSYIYMICKENCSFSPRMLVRGIPARV